MKILGIDEAGRGPVIGPLVMCGFLIDEKNLGKLKKLKVRDSKTMTAKSREIISRKLKRIADNFILVEASAKEIDHMMNRKNLNQIEMHMIHQIINKMNPDRVYIDAFSRNTIIFSRDVLGGLIKKTEIIAENFADSKYPEVSAASVIAKVRRDFHIKKLNKKYGQIGSGYTSDPLTIGFLNAWIKNNKEFPDCVRRSWITSQVLIHRKQQKMVSDFYGE